MSAPQGVTKSSSWTTAARDGSFAVMEALGAERPDSQGGAAAPQLGHPAACRRASTTQGAMCSSQWTATCRTIRPTFHGCWPSSTRASSLLAAALLAGAVPAQALAQQQPGWFVPSQAAPPASAPTGRRGRLSRTAPAPVAQAPLAPPAAADQGPELTEAELQRRAANLPQPPAPPLPPVFSPLWSVIATGDAVKVAPIGNGTLPAPLDANTTYYVIRGATNVLELAASASDATANTPITLTSAGAGSFRLTAPTVRSGQTNVVNDATAVVPNTIKLLPGGAAPPAPIMGVLGVPDVMRASSAAQAVDKVIGARKEKPPGRGAARPGNLAGSGAELQNDAPHLSREQGLVRRTRCARPGEHRPPRLQERIRIIQEAAQVALGQIERTLIGIIRQVAESRGMNLVLHRSQVALNVQEYDITEAVVAQLNRALPTVADPARWRGSRDAAQGLGIAPAVAHKTWHDAQRTRRANAR